MKTDEEGQQRFIELFEDLNAIQAAQNKEDSAGGGAAMVRGANAAVRLAQIAWKRSKNIAQDSHTMAEADRQYGFAVVEQCESVGALTGTCAVCNK